MAALPSSMDAVMVGVLPSSDDQISLSQRFTRLL
jgi:hypothetical protein